MGKRKSRMSKLLAQPKKQPKLETAFTCPFCNHRDSVECRVNLKSKDGPYAVASCYVCQASYCTDAHTLTEPVDVYSEWIDACVRANQLKN